MNTFISRHRLFLSRTSSLFREFLSCIHFSARSSSSSIATKELQKGRASSISHYQSVGGLLNTETNQSQVKREEELSVLLSFNNKSMKDGSTRKLFYECVFLF